MNARGQYVTPNIRRHRDSQHVRFSEELDNMGDSVTYGTMNSRRPVREDSMISAASVNSSTTVEETMRRKLKFFFMNPCEKYRAKGRKPWKLGLQLFKILLVTLQLVLFGNHQFSVIDFEQQNVEAFEQLFLYSWDSSFDGLYYPSTAGSYAVYDVDTFYDRLNFTLMQYAQVESKSIGTYHYTGNHSSEYIPPLKVCVKEYFKLNFTANYNFNSNTSKYCANFSVPRDYSKQKVNETVQSFFHDNNLTITWRSISALLCLRSIIKAWRLRNLTIRFFRNYFNKELKRHDKLRFINFWYVLIVVSDILVIFGSVWKLQLESRIASNYDLCSILLGTGSLLVWFGVLHYLGFFPKYNILILTMKTAAPSVIRFMVCVIVLFMGYGFCGWIVLGPYHPKFKDLNTASECMFSLVNGDDMFATFAEMSNKSTIVWIYSRLFLYTFISLFIYVVLSLFISVIMDTYETVKEYQRHGGPKSEVLKFMSECADEPESGIFKMDDDKYWWMCCCPR
ncbi:mucolipin-3-like, partial [Saccoglossus kowalevskii]|uniref:Mucolipin-3-like n=1 Tax=Saccoglossus kowalevskii TaxID=10224 RepID=A0ABM0MJ95_SACKO